MKSFSFLAASLTAVALLTSCDSASRLASHINGTWAGSPERLTDTDLSYVSMTPAYEFIRNTTDDRTAGTVNLTAQIDTQIPADGFPVDSIGEVPVSFSVAAVVTVSGVWKAVDDDEIIVKFTPSTVVTSVDSKAVCEYASPLTTTDRAVTTELPRPVIDSISRQLSTTMTHYVSTVQKLDDVEIRGTFMKCEIGKRDYTFTNM